MFSIELILIALPAALVAMVAVWIAGKLKLVPSGMEAGWLLAPTFGLIAGGIIMASVIEEFIVRPMQLQGEVLGDQLVTPLSLRSYSAWGFQDVVWKWEYEIDPATAARLSRNCRPDPRLHSCSIAGTHQDGPARGNGRDAFIHMEGATLTIEDWVY